MVKNEAQTDIDLFNCLTNGKKFSEKWKTKKITNAHIIDVLRNQTQVTIEVNLI